jgi:hypothetical protein
MRRRRYIWPILIWSSGIVVLGSQLLRRVVIRLVWVHVSIRYGAGLLVLQVLIVLPPPAHILRHPLLARRQMTTVHHAGLGVCSKPTASCRSRVWSCAELPFTMEARLPLLATGLFSR